MVVGGGSTAIQGDHKAHQPFFLIALRSSLLSFCFSLLRCHYRRTTRLCAPPAAVRPPAHLSVGHLEALLPHGRVISLGPDAVADVLPDEAQRLLGYEVPVLRDVQQLLEVLVPPQLPGTVQRVPQRASQGPQCLAFDARFDQVHHGVAALEEFPRRKLGGPELSAAEAQSPERGRVVVPWKEEGREGGREGWREGVGEGGMNE